MNQQYDQPGRQLREEAMADSPEFSPLLHARIMQRIQAKPSPAPLHIGWHLSRMIRTTSVIAALALLALGVWAYQLHPVAPPHKVARVQPTLPQFELRFPDLSEPADSKLTEARFGYLDRDAKNAVNYVMDQFDVIPKTPARRG